MSASDTVPLSVGTPLVRPLRAALRVEDRDDGPPEIQGHAVRWGSVNSYNERFEPGSLRMRDGRALAMGWLHRDIVGRWLDGRDDGTGFLVRGRLTPTTLGQDAAALLRDGAIDGLSVGFWPKRWRIEGEGGRAVVVIQEATLVEISLVHAPADDDARIVSVRQRNIQDARAGRGAWATNDEGGPMADDNGQDDRLDELAGSVATLAGAVKEYSERTAERLDALERTRDTTPSGYQPEDEGEGGAESTEHRREALEKRATRARGRAVRRPKILERSQSMEAHTLEHFEVADWVEQGIAKNEYRLGAVVHALLSGDRTGLSDTEERALDTGAGSTGDHLFEPVLASRYIDLLRARTLMVGTAGVRTVPMESGTVNYTVVTSDAVGEWLAEGASYSSTDPVFDQKTLTAKTHRLVIPLSFELSEDMIGVGEEALMRAITQPIANEVDRVILRGSGTGQEPSGILNQASNTTELGAGNGAAPADYDDVLDAILDVEQANTMPNAIVSSPRVGTDYGKLATGLSGDLTKLPPPRKVQDLSWLTSTQVPTDLTVGGSNDTSELYVGDFTRAVLGVRPQAGIRARRVDVSLASTFEVEIVAWVRVDVLVEHPAAFSFLTGLRPFGS